MKEKLWNWLALVLGVAAIILLCCSQGCTTWNHLSEKYDPAGNLKERTVTSRGTLLTWNQADYINVTVDPNGVKSLTIIDLLTDPERIKLTSVYGIMEGGD